MAAAVETKLKPGSMIPAFQLMSAEGRSVNTWDYKGRMNMVLAFLPGEGDAGSTGFIRSVAEMYHQYEEEDAVFIGIVDGGVERANSLRDELHPPFPILYDEAGEVTGSYTDALPAVFVADRFGELYAQWVVGAAGFFPSQKEVLDALELINLECPECGAPLEWA